MLWYLLADDSLVVFMSFFLKFCIFSLFIFETPTSNIFLLVNLLFSLITLLVFISNYLSCQCFQLRFFLSLLNFLPISDVLFPLLIKFTISCFSVEFMPVTHSNLHASENNVNNDTIIYIFIKFNTHRKYPRQKRREAVGHLFDHLVWIDGRMEVGRNGKKIKITKKYKGHHMPKETRDDTILKRKKE